MSTTGWEKFRDWQGVGLRAVPEGSQVAGEDVAR